MIRALISALLFSSPALAQGMTELSSSPAPARDEPEVWARLPEPVTNNAVAGVELDGRMMAYSFAGLHAGKTWRDVTADAYACDLTARECREIDPLPDGIGRLAAVAVTVREQIYIFGGYTVAEDHSERSTPEIWRFDPASETYTHITDMPVPVDDTVALPFQDRYIYLVSGWHDTDNVDLVQVYDVEEDRWFEATPFPGAPVFGHAGAMGPLGQILVCGGTAVIPPQEEGARRSFEAIADCWGGQVLEDRSQIEWQRYGSVPGGPFYRGVAFSFGADNTGFALLGGTDNAFNYNGIGYNGEPSEPRGDALQAWLSPDEMDQRGPCTQPPGLPPGELRTHSLPNPETPFMDIRGLVRDADGLVYRLGGMEAGQEVSDTVSRLEIHGEVIRIATCRPNRAQFTD